MGQNRKHFSLTFLDNNDNGDDDDDDDNQDYYLEATIIHLFCIRSFYFFFVLF